jgi:hypothetical protein
LIVLTQEPAAGIGQGNGMQVILFHQGPIQREIRKVAFIAPDGSEIQARGVGSGQSGSVYQAHYSVTRHIETCTVRLTVHERIETVTLSVAIDTGIGFPLPGARRRSLTTRESPGKVTDAEPR